MESVSQEYREFIGYTGLVILLAAFLAVKNHFPSVFKSLKDKNRTYKEEIIYRGIASYYFSLKNMTIHFPLYIAAVVLLVANIANLPKIWGL